MINHLINYIKYGTKTHKKTYELMKKSGDLSAFKTTYFEDGLIHIVTEVTKIDGSVIIEDRQYNGSVSELRMVKAKRMNTKPNGTIFEEFFRNLDSFKSNLPDRTTETRVGNMVEYDAFGKKDNGIETKNITSIFYSIAKSKDEDKKDRPVDYVSKIAITTRFDKNYILTLYTEDSYLFNGNNLSDFNHLDNCADSLIKKKIQTTTIAGNKFVTGSTDIYDFSLAELSEDMDVRTIAFKTSTGETRKCYTAHYDDTDILNKDYVM